MALQTIVPNPNDYSAPLDPNSSAMYEPMQMGTLKPQLTGQLPSLYKPEEKPTMPSLGSLPSMPSAGVLGTLRPIVPNVQEEAQKNLRERAERMSAIPTGLTHETGPAQGFWGRMGRIAEGIGNVAGDVLAPGTMGMIPGTQMNRLLQQRQGANTMAALQKQDIETQDAASRRSLEEAQAQNIPQEAELKREELSSQLLQHGLMLDEYNKLVQAPPEQQGEEFRTEQEMKQTQIYGLKNPWAKLPDKEPLTNTGDINAGLQDRYSVLHPGKTIPKEFQLGDNATKGDFERVDKMLNQEESALGTKAQRDTANSMRAQTMALAMMARQGAANKQDTAQRKQIYTAYQPVMDSSERMNVMTQNYEDAIGKHDQQAMLSLLYNHMGMTMGLQKGAKMTQDLIREAQNTQPWLKGIQAKFDKDGYLSGVTLSPTQMREMVHNAQGRYQEDVRKARGEAAYLGATDDGPKREPNTPTIHYYLGLAGGNTTRAKQMAEQDGWTVK